MAAAHQGGGKALHDKMGNHHIRQSEAGRQDALVPNGVGAELGDYFSVRWAKIAGPRILRNRRPGMVGRRRGAEGRSLHRWWKNVEGRAASGADLSKGPYALSYAVDVERRRDGAAVSLHGRARRRATVAC